MPTFEVLAIRFQTAVPLTPNFLRGRFGKALHDLDLAAYQRWFAPRATAGPSGLHDSPRAFVFRTSPGFGLNLFDLSPNAAEMATAALSRIAAIERITCEKLAFSLHPTREARKVRITFITPTELKSQAPAFMPGANTPHFTAPEFPILFARLRDRISTLRAIYQNGPLDIDFKATAARAEKIRMTRCEIEHVHSERVSRNTGQRHPLSGFTGFAEYEGDLTEFLPYLEIGRYTGIGRQTVWGKGEIHAVVA